MTHSPLVSVAMCTYNGEKYIKEQLDSILGQSYGNLEIIITDDGSRDATVSIIQRYREKDDRIKLYENEQNLGFVKNFEKAIGLCGGEYIALADQDDIWKKDKIKTFVNGIGENVLIYSDAILIDGASNPIGKELIRPTNNLVKGACNKAFLLANCMSGNTLMFKKELVAHILPIPQTISFHDIWIAFVASTYATITFTEEAQTYYRRYDEQVTKAREKDYKNFIDRFNQKKQIRIEDAKVLHRDLETFLTLDLLKDKETIRIIKALSDHYRNYAKITYNKPLAKLLKRYKDEIFAIRKPQKRAKRIFRTAIGLKFHLYTLFVV